MPWRIAATSIGGVAANRSANKVASANQRAIADGFWLECDKSARNTFAMVLHGGLF